MRHSFAYCRCVVAPETLPKPILVACNDVNRYLRHVWRITFPDGAWLRTGTKEQAVKNIMLVRWRKEVLGDKNALL